MTSAELRGAIDRALAEVPRRLASGELDGSGRFYTDEELAAGAATGKLQKKEKSGAAPTAWCALRWRGSRGFRRKTLKTRPNPYDAVAYPGMPNAGTHPDNLAAMATLHGLTPPPVERCRVLEIACGNGSNLIPMAYAIPTSEFVGFDLARLPVERGQRRIAELGLKNVRLFQMDMLEAGADLGRFDYIIAHGFYAWVPEPVRERLLAFCSEQLAGNGVAFISYNAMPGGHLRSMMRGMMLFGSKGIEDPEQEVAEGLNFLRLVVETLPESDVYRALIASQLQRMEKHNPASTRHDEMSSSYHPVHFTEFVEHAGRHGLQYICEAQLPPPPDPCYRPELQSMLESAAGGDFLRREQALDFVRMRGYRETLLCRDGHALRRDFPAQHLRKLLFASQVTSGPGKLNGTTVFTLPGGIRMESNHPGVRALLTELEKAWPSARSFEELEPSLKGTGLVLDGEGAVLLNRLAVAKMIELRTWRAPVAECVSARPRATANCRHEARAGANVTTLLHRVVSLDDARVRTLLGLLDGTRDRRELLEAMKAELPDAPAAELEAGLEANLRMFLATGILETGILETGVHDAP
jgi:SAM-dependent methyltransferase